MDVADFNARQRMRRILDDIYGPTLQEQQYVSPTSSNYPRSPFIVPTPPADTISFEDFDIPHSIYLDGEERQVTRADPRTGTITLAGPDDEIGDQPAEPDGKPNPMSKTKKHLARARRKKLKKHRKRNR